MPLTLTENLDSRKWMTGPDASLELTYTLMGTSDDASAKLLVANSTPENYDGLVRQSIDLQPIWVDSVTGDGQWTATVRYGVKPPAEVGDSTFSFDTGGGTQHVTQSIQTMHFYAKVGTSAPSFGGAIGATHDSVEGVDITVPIYQFSETHYMPDSVITLAYVGKLFALTGRTNAAPFRGLAAGECLFLGASGSKRGPDDWEISFRFAGSANRTGLTVGEITLIDKKGWEYMWVRYADDTDGSPKSWTKKPQYVYIEKVYDEGNYADLGI